jgi:hypothetical protein
MKDHDLHRPEARERPREPDNVTIELRLLMEAIYLK